MNISAVILTRNEEKKIASCIKSLKFADEIVIIDDNSQDETVKIARKLGAKVYSRKLDDFSTQRNFGLKKAKGNWVLFVDADEKVSSPLRNEIIRAINNPAIQYVGFYIRRLDFMWGKTLRHGETGSVRLLRLAKRKAGRWKRRVHEYWEVSGRIGTLNDPLFHSPHQTVAKFIESVNWMSGMHAQANLREGKRSSLTKIIVWPIGKFLYNYIGKLGFLDGMRGFVVALMMSFHSYLAWSKLWILQKN